MITIQTILYCLYMNIYQPFRAAQFLYTVFDMCEEVNKNDLKIKKSFENGGLQKNCKLHLKHENTYFPLCGSFGELWYSYIGGNRLYIIMEFITSI